MKYLIIICAIVCVLCIAGCKSKSDTANNSYYSSSSQGSSAISTSSPVASTTTKEKVVEVESVEYVGSEYRMK